MIGITAVPGGGYMVATSRGSVYAFGTKFRGSPRARGARLSSPVIGITATAGGGYVVATARGNVYPYGTAFYGSARADGLGLRSPVVSISARRAGGYMESTRAGNVLVWAVRGRSRSLGGGAVGPTDTTPDGPFLLDTTATQGSCQGIRLGSDFFPTGQGASADGSTCSGPATQPHLLVLDDGTSATSTAPSGGQDVTPVCAAPSPTPIVTGGCASFMAVTPGSGASAALQNDLTPYLSDGQAHLVVLTGPPGSVTNDPDLPNQGFSYVFKLNKGVSDIADAGYGWRNVGQALGAGGEGTPGELRGWLQSVVGADAGIFYSFVAADHPTFDTQAAETTTVSTTPAAPKDLAVDVLRSTAPSGQVLDIPGASTTEDKTIEGAKETDLPSQRWLLKASSVAPGYYHMVNVNSGLCLDVNGPWPPNGTGALVQFPCDSTPTQEWKNQLWKPNLQSDGSYTLVTDIDQKSVASFNADGTVGVATDTGAPGQHFAFVPMTGALAPQAVGMLSSALGPALELAGGRNTTGVAGTKIVAANETDQSTQQWLVVPTGNPAAYPGAVDLVSINTAQCLSVPLGANGQADPKAQPDQETCASNYDNSRQLWKPQIQPDGSYTLVNAQTRLALTLSTSGAGQLKGARPKPKTKHHTAKGKHHKAKHRRLKAGQAASTQSMWFTSRSIPINDGYPATGSHDFSCSDYVPSGLANLFPYLVPDGDSYAFNNKSGSGHVHIAANLVKSDALTGKLSTLWSNYNTRGDWALKIQQECTGNNPGGWSVSSLGPESVSITAATIDASLSGFSGNVAVHVDYGTGTASYGSHTADQNLTGNGRQQSVALKVTGLQPDTTYHYRIVAARTAASIPNAYSGSDQTFTTPAYNYGTPVTQAADAGTPAQRFTFRPLSKTVTTRVGNTSYETPMPLSWSGFEVLGLDRSLSTSGPQVYYTNTPDTTTDGENQADMASALGSLRSQQDDLVVVQSVNAPKPTTANWNALGNQIGALGGNPEVFDALDGSGDYALVGCGSCGSDAAQASVLTGTANQDHVSGILQRDAQSDFQPLLSDTAVLPNTKLDYGLLPLAYTTPSPWPRPTNPITNTPVTTAANAAVLRDMANGLGLTASACYEHPPGQPDVRSAYCSNTVDWTIESQTLEGGTFTQPLKPPGQITTLDCSDPSNQPIAQLGYSDADWCAVGAELIHEFSELGAVKKEIGTFQSLFANGETESLIQNNITNDASTINGLMGVKPSGDASGGMDNLAASLIGFSSEAIPEPVGTVLGAVSEMMYVGAGAGALADGTLDLSNFQANVDDFVTQTLDRVQSSAAQFGTVFDLLAQDPTKLATAANYAGNQWSLNDNQEQTFQQQLLNGIQAQLYTDLIPAYYTRFSVQVPPKRSLHNLQCVIATNGDNGPVYDSPLSGEPSSATLNPVTGIGSSGQAQRPYTWYLAAGNYPTPASGGLSLPQPELTDSLYTSVADKGIGLNKTLFFITSGFGTHDNQPPTGCNFLGP